MTSTVTMDFRDEYEAERSRWLRRRILWFCGVCLAFFGIDFFGSLIAVTMAATGTWEPLGRDPVLLTIEIASGGLCVAVLIAVLARMARGALSTDRCYRVMYWTIVIIGLLTIAIEAAEAVHELMAAEEGAAGRGLPSFGPLGVILFVHVLAALFVSWTPKQAILPLIPLLIASALIAMFLTTSPWIDRLTWVAFSPLVGVPGVLIGWARHGSFRKKFQFRMLRGHYGEMKRELTDARRIHDVLFPTPITDGPVHFDFRYEPMRQIGGDYLYTCLDESRDDLPSRLSVVIIDVTGHGIGAALTVNRIHGELERLFGERSDISPGETLASLNHYINVTLAKHNVYATAICMRVDPHLEVVEWASAGHPPAFVLTADGLIDRLESTAIMLGAADDEAFDAAADAMPLRKGDSVIAYTDGVTEARNDRGRMLKIEGMQALMASIVSDGRKGSRTEAVLKAVQEHRFGPVTDDTLVVEVGRPRSK